MIDFTSDRYRALLTQISIFPNTCTARSEAALTAVAAVRARTWVPGCLFSMFGAVPSRMLERQPR